MPSDVEMSNPDHVVRVQAPSPPHHTPITVDDDSLPPTSPPPTAQFAQGELSSTSTHDVEEALNLTKEKGKKSKPPSASKSAASATGAKPKSTKPAPRSPSPSPPPPPSRPPLQTIRLEIKLGNADNYEVDIAALAKETGQRPPTPTPAKRDTSDDSHSEPEGDDEADHQPQEKKRKRKRRNHTSEYYDVTDPFIDDSELAVDERTFFAQTKQQGFYVSSGQVALLDVPVQKKPKSKKVNILAPAISVSQALSNATLPPSLAPLTINSSTSSRNPAPSNQTTPPAKSKSEEGTRESPIALYSDIDEDKASLAGVKRKLESPATVLFHGTESANGSTKKKRKTIEIHPFHPELEEALDALREEIKKESWENKSKFPPRLKPVLAQVALKAIILGDYDDNFFNLMPRLFPYNRFTMHKLIKRTVWRDHTNLLLERQEALLQDLAALTQEGFSKAQEEWEKVMSAWERRQERSKGEGEGGAHLVHSLEGTPVPSDAQITPTFANSSLPSREDGNDTGMEPDDGAGQASNATKSSKDAHPPTKKYRLTDKMKEIIWQLVCISNECCRIENEKNQLEGSTQVVSDQGVRKNLYQKIVAAFPDGWISSGQISREVSVMKKKYEKEVAENE